MLRRLLLVAPLLLTACGGRGDGVVQIDVPEPERRITLQTAEPAPSPTPAPEPTPDPTPGPTPTPVPPPSGATITSLAGTQRGAAGPFCWSEQIAGPATCNEAEPSANASVLDVREGEEITLELDAQIPPDDESVRPFRGTRSGYPVQQIQPALITDLVVDLPEGAWSLDVCAAWHGRGQPICWLFRLDVVGGTQGSQ